MRLKSLKLAGFKSFAHATTFTFRHGITAIVGPNGCGKSNVIDAIRWVLGETSAKQLRGGAMRDVIFAGTADKVAKSVASVELIFEHTQDEKTGICHELNVYQELSVRRQVTLDGRSDYFINGTRCRRRDVIDVFLGTGLGARSYAVIEQGMIGRIVESNPMQLREFIEEAAGISRYQARRFDTQKKLEKTQENLARLHDMQSELERQYNTLSKQAVSAQTHAQLSASLADIQQQLALEHLYHAKHHQQKNKQAHEQSTVLVAALQANYERLKQKQDTINAHISEQQRLKDATQNVHYQHQLACQQAEQQLNTEQAQVHLSEQHLIGFKTQRQQLTDERNILTTKQREQADELALLRPKLMALNHKREAYQKNEPPLQQAWQATQQQLAQLQECDRHLEQRGALNKHAQQRLQLSQDKWTHQQKNWQVAWAQLQQLMATEGDDNSDDNKNDNDEYDTHHDNNKVLATKITTIENQLQHIARQQDSVSARLADLQPQAHTLQQQLAMQQRELVEQEKRHALLAGEYDTLHKILHPLVATKSINAAKNTAVNLPSTPFMVTTLREHIELSTQGQYYAHLLDGVLALWLSSHIFMPSKSAPLWQALEDYFPEWWHHNSAQKSQYTDTLTKNITSHGLWLPTPQNEGQANANLDAGFIDDLPQALIDKVLPLSQLIAKPALALWQQCYLYVADEPYDSQNTAKNLIHVVQALPASALLLTADGWMFSRVGAMNIRHLSGVPDEKIDGSFLSQRLSQRQRLNALETMLDALEQEMQTQQQCIKHTQINHDILNISLAETHAQAQQLTQDGHRYQQKLVSQRATYERWQANLQRLNADKAALAQAQQDMVQEQQALDYEQQQLAQDRAKLTPQLLSARADSQQQQAAHHARRHAQKMDDERRQALQLLVQKSEIELVYSVSSLAQISEQYKQSLQQTTEVKARLMQHQQQRLAAQRRVQQLQTDRNQQQTILSEHEHILGKLKHDFQQQKIAIDSLQKELQNQQQTQAMHATEQALSEQRLQDASQRLQACSETIDVPQLLSDFIAYERRMRPEKIAELQTKQHHLEQKIRKLGAVNLAAVAELAAVNERLEPLTQQTCDIAASMQTLTAAIAAIDATTKTLFMQMLEAVNRDMATLFAKVFGGGHACLTLNSDDMPANTPKSEQWRAGLTLMAQPKGKRNSRLAVLSGGEKTLTALSLIFAIFKQHPAPFCVLDEVDAPLDDANVARFTSLIHELADDLQFIFISHNKLAMQIADELKGITMPTAGISALVSVSLEEAAQYIDD